MALKDLLPWHWGSKRVPVEREHDVFANLQEQINRVLDEFRRDLDWPALESLAAGPYGPRVDLCETDDGLRVTAELPGMKEKDIEISLSDNALTIRGEKRDEHENDQKGYFVRECTYGTFQRVIPVPADIDADRIDARFNNGVLTVELPTRRRSNSDRRKIPLHSDS